MGFGTAITTCFQKYVGFQGRARRSEYWWWVLFFIIVAIVANIADTFVDPAAPGEMIHYGYIYGIAALALILPSLAVTVRRLHDTNRSGFWIFLGLIPLIGAIILIIWYCQKGTASSNTYGPDPTA
jgi:uncharacterized membrane protein YhaH (DUF805 family)